MNGARYDFRNATMVDLIVKAYGVTADKVFDGPSWLEYNRFDISAAIPPKTSASDVKLMLQALLADRFQLAIRQENRPLLAYVLTAPKGKQKLKEADGSGDTGCGMSLEQPRGVDSAGSTPPTLTISYTCRNITMAAFAEGMNRMAQQFIGTNPVQDRTGLEGKWDFSFKYTSTRPGGTNRDEITLPDALDKQVGLTLKQERMSLPILVVEKANLIPSQNEPDVAQKIPVLPTEFEVATIKPSAPPSASGPFPIFGIQGKPGGQVEISNLSLKGLMQAAWSLPIVGGPKWMETDLYNIVAKMPGDGVLAAPNILVDTDAVWVMVRALLKDRFKLVTHIEARAMTAYALTAPKPKLKEADPFTRTKWTSSNSTFPLNGSSAPSRTIKFQNMSMAQLAETLQYLASTYIQSPVIDETELEGSFDFTLTFSLLPPAQRATILARAPDAAGGGDIAADPIGGVSLFEAVDKQLGLKLVEQKRLAPMLVIDHIERKPTDN